MNGLFSNWIAEGNFTPIVTAYYYKQWTNYEMSDHTHRSMEVMYVIGGSCVVEIGESNSSRKTIAMKKGEFIFLNGTIPHRLIVKSTCRMLNVEFSLNKSKAIFPSLHELSEAEPLLYTLMHCSLDYLLLREPNTIYHTLKSLVTQLDKVDKRGIMIQLLLVELLLRIAELYQNVEGEFKQGKDHYVQKAIEYIQANYDCNLRVSDIAKHVNLHPAYLQKIFKNITGQSILDYLNLHRIEKMKMFLIQTDIPLIEIVDYVGIGSRQYMHYLFKKYTGMTPKSFRDSFEAQRRGIN